MKNFMHSLISQDRTAYIKGRYTGESVRLIDDLLKHAGDENIDGILLAVDIEKAFYLVDHNFMLVALQGFGFWNNFVRLIRNIYLKILKAVSF